MRSVFAVIVLMLATGVVLPADAVAGVPTKVQKWDCTLRVLPLVSVPAGDVVPILSGGVIRDCETRQQGSATLSLVQDLPGGPDPVLLQEEASWAVRPGKTRTLFFGVGACSPATAPPTAPFYVRMKVRNATTPGSVTLASPRVANPCPDGTYPVILDLPS
jgi:hypothetical protein